MLKKLLTILFILFISQNMFAQRIIDEYGIIDSDLESWKIDSFLLELNNQPNSKGLIIIYAGLNKERLGNILAHIEGIKYYMSLRRFDKNRINFFVVEGKEPLFKEIWIAKSGELFPKFHQINWDFGGITNKYLYAKFCLSCDPVVGVLRSDAVKFSDYAGILKKYPSYKGQIVVNDKTESAFVKNKLTTEEKLPRNRYSINIRKAKKGEEIPQSVDLFLISNNIK